MIRDKNIAPGANIDLAKIAGGGAIGSPLGKTLWVDSQTYPSPGADNRTAIGTKERPFATLAAAVAQCRHDKMDYILVAPGHTETLTGAPCLTIDKRTVTIVGLRRGNIMPTFLIDGAATAYVAITGADASVSGLKFKAGHANVAKAILITADGVVVEHCVFVENTTNENFVAAISIGAADNDSDGCVIRYNEVYSVNTAGNHGVVINKNQHLLTIQGNWIHGDFAANKGAIYAPTNEIMTAIRVIGNVCDNNATDTVTQINIPTTSTGVMARNLSSDGDTNGTPFIFGGGSMFENYHTAVDAASGFLYPAIAT